MLWVRWRRDARYSAVRGTCGCRSQKSGGAGGSPLRPLAGVGALAGAPPRPRYWILRRPRRQRRGAPARRLAGVGGLLSRRRQRFNGGRCRRRSSVVGGVPLSPVGAVVPAGCGGGGCCRGAAGGWAVPLRFTQSPRRRPAPSPRPLAPAGAGWGFRWLRPAGTE